jgi:hypothetical protein
MDLNFADAENNNWKVGPPRKKAPLEGTNFQSKQGAYIRDSTVASFLKLKSNHETSPPS